MKIKLEKTIGGKNFELTVIFGEKKVPRAAEDSLTSANPGNTGVPLENKPVEKPPAWKEFYPDAEP